ncbi:MAG: hypothetical protein PHT55_07275 [Spirochaetales bacterium]|nr:hypothetical protein [Spirochaetales bacterium]
MKELGNKIKGWYSSERKTQEAELWLRCEKSGLLSAIVTGAVQEGNA